MRNLANNADVLIYDAQYSPHQLSGEKKGWGHSSWLEGTRIARECGVKKLMLFHHDPGSDDHTVDRFVERARQEFPSVFAAAEGNEIQLPKGDLLKAWPAVSTERRRERRYRLEVPVRLIWRPPHTGNLEYGWHGAQLVAGNLYVLLGLILLVVTAAYLSRIGPRAGSG